MPIDWQAGWPREVKNLQFLRFWGNSPHTPPMAKGIEGRRGVQIVAMVSVEKVIRAKLTNAHTLTETRIHIARYMEKKRARELLRS